MPSGIFTLKQQELALGQGAWSNQKPLAVDYLVVAGGGGAGASNPGGAGAGGVLTGSVPVASGSAITVTIGSGGSGTSGSSAPGNGTNSVFGSITATGGGKGENNGLAAGSGGSGGGAGASFLYGQGTAGQGNAGGSTNKSGGGDASSGGGGAGNVGESPVVYNAGGAGGAGVGSYISGTLTGYGGGGAGSTGNTGTGYSVPVAAYGGGGAGAISANGGSGTANTGGGGSAGAGYTGGSGGSGIVIISYPDTYAAAASTTGSPTVSTSGSGSLAFNGSTQYLNYNGQSGFAFGTGDFTIEFFVYLDTLGGSDVVLYDSRPSTTQGAYPLIYFNGTTLYYFTNSATAITGTSALSATTWLHIAVTRSGTSTRMFVNGTQVGSTYSDSTNYLNGASRPAIATGGYLFGSNLMTGKISNLRVVKGTAVYTANFTAPSAPLTAITNTQLLLSAVSGAYLADGSTNAFTPGSSGSPTWNQLSPFATGLGYKNRVYTWTSSGSITF